MQSTNQKKKLTKAFVDSQSSPGFYWDNELIGFGLRISGKTKTYIVQTAIDGQDRRRSIDRHGVITAEEARKRARQMLAGMHTGIDPSASERARRANTLSLADLARDYLLAKNPAVRTTADYRGYMQKYFSDWADKPISYVTMDRVEQRHKNIGEVNGGAQADVAMRFLRALFNYAEGIYTGESGEALITQNPTKRLSAKNSWNKPKPRETYIAEYLVKAWYDATVMISTEKASTSHTVCDYLLFLLFTGLRRSEAAKLRWEHVDFQGRLVTLPRENVKNRTNFSFPLTTFTYALLKRRHEAAQTEWVFPGSGKTGHLIESRYVISKITELSQVTFTPHDLRRSFATYAATATGDRMMVKRLMNHMTNQDITERYMRGVEHLRKPAQLITDYILSLAIEGHNLIRAA